MSEGRGFPVEEAGLLAQIEQLLADPALADNVLREPLERLLKHSEVQRQRLERLVRISDGYHTISRVQTLTLEKQYDRQLRRVEKIMRISDGYQNSLREMSVALREAALHDPLTGLGNRRYLMERLDEETARAARKQSVYAVGILDVDFFKAVNDRHGHDAGDRVLGDLARTLQASLRQGDICGRWGGEEFLLLLPDTSLEEAQRVAERIRSGIRQIRTEGVTIHITASMGLTISHPGEALSAIVKRADNALLKAKNAGRDRIELG
jgi:diguanylate cyclase